MLPLIEKILALVPFNGAFKRRTLQVAVSIFIMKMVTRASMLRNLLTHNLPQHMRQHLPPPRPVMIYIRPPQIQRVRNSFGRENVRELTAAIRILVWTLPRDDVDRVGAAQYLQQKIIIQIREVIDR